MKTSFDEILEVFWKLICLLFPILCFNVCLVFAVNSAFKDNWSEATFWSIWSVFGIIVLMFELDNI